MTKQPTQATIIDPRSDAGFIEIANTFGYSQAHMARINAYRGDVLETQSFRWHARRPTRNLWRAMFDLAYFMDDSADGTLRSSIMRDLEADGPKIYVEYIA